MKTSTKSNVIQSTKTCCRHCRCLSSLPW